MNNFKDNDEFFEDELMPSRIEAIEAPEDLSRGDLTSYLISNTEEPNGVYNEEMDAEIEQKLNYVRKALVACGFSSMGNLLSATQEDVKQTVDCVYSLVRQRQIDIEFRKKNELVAQRYKNELMIINKKYELLQRDYEQLKRVLGKTENDLTKAKQQVKAHANDHKASKEDYKQSLNKLEQKVAQISYEMRKNGTNFSKLQEQYRKNVKESLQYRNNFDATSKVASEGIEVVYKHLEVCESPSVHGLALMLRDGYERTQQNLLVENQKIKECLKLIQDELANALKQVVGRLREKLPEIEVKDLDPIYLKPIVFQSSITAILNDVYQIARENAARMQSALETIIIALSS
eukprot:TRINITY_DN4573_c0_g2_i1.p1 TRINITY_DN4573_c0_g2~~TRINITY_DN4573_c0_g2_i1.p1  ORF type:complete len:348 (-),score=71.67 TRINITY_DN4573_c0_g2_i1:103-1146(-)